MVADCIGKKLANNGHIFIIKVKVVPVYGFTFLGDEIEGFLEIVDDGVVGYLVVHGLLIRAPIVIGE